MHSTPGEMINGTSLWASRPRYRYGLHSPQKFVAAAKLVLSTSSREPAGWSLFIKEKVSIGFSMKRKIRSATGRKSTESSLNSNEKTKEFAESSLINNNGARW